MSRESFENLVALTVPIAALHLLLNLSGWLWYTLLGKYLIVDLSFSGNELGLVMMIYNLSFAVSALPAGILSDIIMSRRVLLVGAVACAIGILLMAFSRDVVMMSIACLIIGFGDAFTLTAITVHTVKSGGIRHLATLYGFVLWAGTLGELLGSFMSGYVKEYLGSQALFTLSSIMSLAPLPMLPLIRERSQERRATGSISLASIVEPIKLLGFHDILRLLTLGLIFHTVGYCMFFPFISVHASFAGLADREIGIINSAILLSTFLITLPCGILADRIGSKPILLAHILLSSASWMLYGLSSDLTSVFLAAAFLGAVNAMDYPARRRLLIEASGEEAVGTLIGALDFFISLASIPGPMIGGILYELTGVSSVFLIASLINLASIPFLLRIRVHAISMEEFRRGVSRQ